MAQRSSRHRWVDHTAELEVEIQAPTEEDVFAQAAAALGELLGDANHGPSEARLVSVEAGDRPALLAAFIEELVFLAETEQLVPVGVGSVELGSSRVEAMVQVAHGEPPHLVKAVTYHRLAFERHGDGYLATAVLDV